MEGERPSTCSDLGEDLRRIGNDVRQVLRKMGPSEEAAGHFRTARIELLRGFRQIIDDRINNLSRKPTAGTSGAQGARVTVE